MAELKLDNDKVNLAREAAKKIASQVENFVSGYTTTAVERTVLRLMGVDGTDDKEVPLPNVAVDQIKEAGGLTKGAAYWVGNACLQLDKTPKEVAGEMAAGNINLFELNRASFSEIQTFVENIARETLARIARNRLDRDKRIVDSDRDPSMPMLYVIVATGNIYEDVIQAQAAARQGADVIAVIRSTAQSLLDYVPYGPTKDGYGGTFATQENFKIMRRGLDEVGEELGRYIYLVNYCSGLCMPEIAAMGALERLDMMLNDALYGILFRDINMQRTIIDQHFSRQINAYAGIIINTGEDNYLTTDDAYTSYHTVLASQFINEQLAFKSGLLPEQMGLGHAFEINPDMEDSFLYELAQAQLIRQVFDRAPLKFMPPTKYKTGNIFKAHLMDAMFNLAGIMTGQGIQLLGMPTEAIHTPHLHDRFLSIENARYIMTAARNLGEELSIKNDGKIQERADKILADAAGVLEDIASKGLFSALEEGTFAGIKRQISGGKGLEGVVQIAEDYLNPFQKMFKENLPLSRGGDAQ